MATSFTKGTLVEVSSDEDGFRGVWFPATIVRAVGKNRFSVEYQSLMADDNGNKPLRETADSRHIRPCPPKQEHTTEGNQKFAFLEEVDAFCNDGWWVGIVSKVLRQGSGYHVYFRYSKEEMEFEPSDLRIHQEWIDGRWVCASKALELILN